MSKNLTKFNKIQDELQGDVKEEGRQRATLSYPGGFQKRGCEKAIDRKLGGTMAMDAGNPPDEVRGKTNIC
jgi:hypothetical protein